MIIALAIVAICCVITAIFVGFVVIFRDKRERVSTRAPEITISNSNNTNALFDDVNDNRGGMEHPFMQQLSRITFPDSSNHSYSGKDSGTGDDIPLEAESIGHYPEQG